MIPKSRTVNDDEKVKDPTENVQALSEAANRRQDDLREANNKLTKSKITRLDSAVAHATQMAEIRGQHAKEMAEIRETHARDMREKEVARLDSIRQVDVTAVRTEADRALAAIQTLAATTATNAENLRNALNATAATIAKSTSDTVSQITERIAALEKSSYEGVGKQRLADPQMAELVAEMKIMRESKANVSGVGQGIGLAWGVVVVVVTMIISAAVSFMAFGRAPAAVAQPQIIYVPTPASGAGAPPVISAPATVVPPPR